MISASTTVSVPTEDQMSPYPVFSPSYSCDADSPVLIGNNGHSAQNNQVFTFDNNSAPFTSFQSAPDFNYTTQQQFVSPLAQPNHTICVPSSQYQQPPPPPYNASLTTVDAASVSNSNLVVPDSYQLEEVDQTALLDDARSLTQTPITEQEKLDQKRMRNNKACRASRERRKRRKAETEALAEKLQDDNRQLKEQIRQLEKDVKSAQEIVQRRMSQSYSDHQVVANFDKMTF